MAEPDADPDQVRAWVRAATEKFQRGESGWDEYGAVWSQASKWREMPGGIPREARGAYVAFADLQHWLLGEYQVAPHNTDLICEPALQICIEDPEYAHLSAKLATVVASKHMDFGDLDLARPHLTEERLKYYDEHCGFEAAWCRLQAAGLARTEGQAVRTEELLATVEDMLAEAEPQDVLGLQVFLDNERFGLALYKGQLDVAAVAFGEMEGSLEAYPHWLGSHALRLNKIRLRLAVGRTARVPELAQEGIQQVLQDFVRITGRARRRANALLARYEMYAGVALRRQGQFEAARTYLEASLESKPLGTTHEQGLSDADADQAYANLAILAAKEGEYDEAREHCDEAARLSENHPRAWVRQPHILALRAQVERLAGGEVEALLAEFRAGYQSFLERWEQTKVEPGGIGFLQYADRRLLLEELVELCLYAEGKSGAQSALRAVLQAQARGSLARSLGLGVAELSDLRAWLSEDGGALIYLPGIDASHLFLVDRNHCDHVHLPALEDLRPLQNALGRALQPGSTEAWQPQAKTLAAALLPEEARQALHGWHEVTIIGADLFGTAPIEVLPLEAGDTTIPLGIAIPVTHLPSVPVGLHLRRRQTKAPAFDSPLLSLIAPNFDGAIHGGLEAIGRGDDHAKDLKRVWGEGDFHVGPDATRQSMLGARPRAAHFLTHGYQRQNVRRPMAIALAGSPGYLDAAAIERIWSERNAPDLVTLGVCRGGRGPSRFGEDGVQHLGGAFLGAGAEVVVLAVSDLDRDATMFLLESFYRHEKAGVTPAEAMRRARAEAWRSSAYSHASHWGTLQVLGIGHDLLQR